MPKDSNNLQPPSLYLEKPLPSSDDAERIVLGAIIVDNDLIVEAVDTLAVEDFYTPRNRMIYKAMLKLFAKSERSDAILISEELKKVGQLESIGGIVAITSLTHGIPHFTHLSDYTKVIKDKAIARNLVKRCNQIQQDALSEEYDSSELLDKAEHNIFALRQGDKSKARSIIDLMPERLLEIKKIKESGKNILGLKTDYALLDKMLSGIQPKKNIIIAARPSMGKSALALNIVDGITKHNPEAVVIYFSLEMSGQELTDRLLCGKADIDTNEFALGIIQSHQREKLQNAIVELGKQKIYIVDTPSLSILEMKSHIRKIAKKEKRVDVVVTDHLGLMSANKTVKYEGRREAVSENARAFKPIAKEFNCTTIELSQLNRACEARNPPIPMLSDLRETGDIEQEADTVIMIYREEYYSPTPDNQGKAEILITKNRGGATGNFDMTFRKEYTRFENYYG